MKVTLCLLVLLPLVFCASKEERFLLDSVRHFLDSHHVLDKLKAALGSDTSLAACHAACPGVVALIPGGSLLSGPLCNLACDELHKLG